MTNKKFFLAIFVFCLLSIDKVYSASDEESCVSYGPEGGNVYPVGSNTNAHELQYTKAVSKLKKKHS